MKKILFYFQTVLLIGLFGGISAHESYAQEYYANWMITGNYGSLRFPQDDSIEYFPTKHFSFMAGMSDSSGRFLYYLGADTVNYIAVNEIQDDGYLRIYDKNDSTIDNGDSIRYSYYFDGLIALPLIQTNDTLLESVFISQYFPPYKKTKVPSLETRRDIGSNCAYNLIQTNLRTLKSRVIRKNVQMNETPTAYFIHAVRHANGKDWWVVMHERDSSNKFLFYIIDSKGFRLDHTQNIGTLHDPGSVDSTYYYFGEDMSGDGGFSFDGKRYAYATWGGIIDVFDFDRCSGMFSNWRSMGINPKYRNGYFVGTSLSPDGSKLYVSIHSGFQDWAYGLWQLDLNTDPPTRYPLDTAISMFFRHPSDKRFKGIIEQWGVEYCDPLKCILIANQYNGMDTIGVTTKRYMARVKNPNLPGAQCNYELESIEMALGALPIGVRALPTVPNHRLPAFPVSYFRHDTTVCEKRSFILGYDSSIDTAYRKFRWRNYSGTLRDSGMVIWGTLRHGDTLIRTMHCSSAECLLRVDTFVVKVIKTNPPCPVDREKLDFETNIKIYPNPAQESISITAHQPISLIRFYDMNGKKIKEETPPSSSQSYETKVKGLPRGVYLLQVETDGGSVTQKVVVV